MADEKDSFQFYSEELDDTDIRPRSRKELAGLHAEMVLGNREAHKTLWLHGTKLVLKIVNKLRNENLLRMTFEDAVAEGNLAIGDALSRWEPRKSTFATWVWIRIRGAVLNEDNRTGRGYMTGGVDLPVQPYHVAYETTVSGEGGSYIVNLAALYGVAENLGEQTIVNEELYDQIGNLPDREKEYIFLRFFQDKDPGAIAEEAGVSRQMVEKVIRRGLERLREGLQKP